MRALFLTILFIPMLTKAQNIVEPSAKKIPKTLTTNGHNRVDNYYWMNERDSKEVLDYIAQENKVSESFFDSKKALIDELLAEFENRIDPNEQSAPFEMNGNLFQVHNKEGLDYSIIMQLNGNESKVFIDENDRAKGHNYYDLGEWLPSPDNKMVALSEDFIGRRNYTITIRGFATKSFLKDKISETDGSFVWANDNKTIFYVKKDPVTLRSFQVFRHELGTPQSKDILVYEDLDEKYNVDVQKSLNGQYIVINSGSSTTSETLLVKADQPTEKAQIFLPRKKDHIYYIEPHTDGFYILSNENAKNRKVLFVNTIPKKLEDCKEVIPHSIDVLLEEITVFEKHLVVQERTNGLQKIKIIDLTTNSEKYVTIDEETYSLGLGVNDNFVTPTIYYRYNSMTTPSTVYKYDLSSGEKELFHRNELIDKSFSPENYDSQRIWVTANDGTKIPVSLVYKKGLDLSKAPCLLYAYGSYGYTIPDRFSATRLSLLDRGFVYALAHIRGGKYMGEEWYENGKFLKKKNTFTDFINVAEVLGMKGYCDKSRIYAQGGSAGGLLMGAVTNMAPYLFKGVIAQVPFVDVLTTMLDESIPLTVGEYEEWGNPNEEEYYYYMLNYSPYDNIHAMDYPNLLITTGYHDSQVQYWEPLKWIAKIREYRTNENQLLLDCNMDAGHGGGSGRSVERLEIAKEFSFILGLEETH